MTKQVHDLKTWPEPFEAMKAGLKRFEYRKNDRDFKEGDFLRLIYYNPMTGQFTNTKTILVEVTYILKGPEYNIPEGYCIMSTRRV